jgi:hypothetical protein
MNQTTSYGIWVSMARESLHLHLACEPGSAHPTTNQALTILGCALWTGWVWPKEACI